jgi:hypothetical protein
MTTQSIEVLHDHYKDTCSLASAYRSSRDRHFYLILAVLAVILFDLYAPKDFSRILAETIQKQLDTSVAPDLRYLRSILWFVLLGVTLRYCQVALLLERQYIYLHGLEELLARSFEAPAFTREGKAYLSSYSVFSTWSHHLYTLIFPLWLAALVIYRTARELPCCVRWAGLDWFDLIVAAALCITIVLYLFAFHRWKPKWYRGRDASASAETAEPIGALRGSKEEQS